MFHLSPIEGHLSYYSGLSKDRERIFVWVTPMQIAQYGVMYPMSISVRWPIFHKLQQMVVPMATSPSNSWGLRYKWLFTMGILQHIQPQLTLTQLPKTMTVWMHWEKKNKKQFDGGRSAYALEMFLSCSLSSLKIQKVSDENDFGQTDWRTLHFFCSHLKRSDHFEQQGQPDGCLPEASTLFQGHLGDIEALSSFSQMIILKPPS